MTLLRLVIVALAMALGTLLLSWWAVPLIGAGYGLVARGTRHPGLVAGAGGAAGWGGYLAVVAFGGAPIGRFAGDLAVAMGLPGWGPHLATLLLPALLAAPAAYLTSQLRRRSDTGPVRR